MKQEIELKKANLKQCNSMLRKLRKDLRDAEDEISFAEEWHYIVESNIKDVKERIKKLTPKIKN